MDHSEVRTDEVTGQTGEVGGSKACALCHDALCITPLVCGTGRPLTSHDFTGRTGGSGRSSDGGDSGSGDGGGGIGRS